MCFLIVVGLFLCYEVLYHDNMKVYGLRELIMLYISWNEQRSENEEDGTQSN